MREFCTSIHTHVQSLDDADINIAQLCERIKELNGDGCVITDHGAVSVIEDARPVFEKYGLKLVPGVEAYVDGGILGRLHLILIAVNDNGYKQICKIITEANRTNFDGGYPTVTKEILQKYVKKGDVIATSACMQGVISAIYLLNDKVEKKIEKILTKQKKFFDPHSGRLTALEDALKEAEKELDARILARDNCKAKAEQKFTAREKAVAKSGSEADKKQLEEEKLAAQKAANKLPELKESVEKQKKIISGLKKELKEDNDSAKKFLAHKEEIENLKKELKTDDELDTLAEAEMKWYVDLFGIDNFYAEVQYHGIEEEAKCFPKVANLAHKLGVNLIASNDVHILNNTEDERLKRCILRSLRFGDKFEEETIGDNELYLKDNFQLKEALVQIISEQDSETAIDNIEKVFSRCHVEFKTDKHYPKFSENSEKEFDEAIKQGIAWRFPNGMDKEHQLRLEREIAVIKSMGYVDYHLVVKDFLEYGRLLGFVPKEKLDEVPLTIPELKKYIESNGWKNGGMLVGPGRGSAGGSLVCYVFGITNIDPLKYGLLFERFLNPERISMPDIDSDLSNTTRGKVIEYVQNKYGANAVCGIMTKTVQAPKGAINIAAKYYGLKTYGTPLTSLGRQIAKDVTTEVGVSFASIVASNGKLDEIGKPLCEYLASKYAGNKDALEVIKWAQIIEGSFTAYGAHAAGIVISDNNDVGEYLPLRFNSKLAMMQTQCNMAQVEDNGLLKFDFLGLKTLDVVTECLRMIESNYGIIIDPLKIDLEDSKVFKLMAEGYTNAVFQFESAGMKAMLKRFKPTCFEDLIILVSMFRPGPLQYLDGVIDVKNGKKSMTFLTPMLEEITGKTYGAIVYQEQVMEICQKLAGFTLGHADEVRRYMSKKKKDKLAHEREAFLEGCSKNDISKEIADELFNQMMDFASYAFNKSHATTYAYNAYVTAWLKCYYPAEFFASALNWTDKDGLSGLMAEAKKYVEVKAPNINYSGKEFEVHKGVIWFGLSAVAGVKDSADEIIKERLEDGNFKSLKDFLSRYNANATVARNLILAGAFDDFSENRKSMVVLAEEMKNILPKLYKKQMFLKCAKLCLPIIETSSIEEIINIQEKAGLNAEIKEKATANSLAKRIETAKTSEKKYLNELDSIREKFIEENATERMNAEKDLLGIYVTAHPMDYYPSSIEVGCDEIYNINEETCVIYGVISNLSIKQRKSDGAKFAVFDLEDRTGSVSVSCFTKIFKRYENTICNGKVIKIKGKVIVEEYNDNTELKFSAEECEEIKMKKNSYIMEVSSYASFHIDNESTVMEEFAVKDGCKLFVFDKALDEIRECAFLVSEDINILPNVKKFI